MAAMRERKGVAKYFACTNGWFARPVGLLTGLIHHHPVRRLEDTLARVTAIQTLYISRRATTDGRVVGAMRLNACPTRKLPCCGK